MIRLLQYSIFLFLIANGLSAHLGNHSNIYIEDLCEVVDNDNEADQGDDEERENNSREFVVTPERKLLRETVQNEAEPNTSVTIPQSPQPYIKANYTISNKALSFWDTYPKVPTDIKRHMHYSKRASDDTSAV